MKAMANRDSTDKKLLQLFHAFRWVNIERELQKPNKWCETYILIPSLLITFPTKAVLFIII